MSSQDDGSEENVGQGGRWHVDIRQLRPSVHDEIMYDVVGQNWEIMDKKLIELACI